MPGYQATSSRRKAAKQHVYIAVPTYGPIDYSFMMSLNAAKDVLLSHDISVDVAVLEGNCHVDDARNDLCRMFLESQCSDMVFIDADVVFSASSVRQLLSHQVDIVGGVYPYKNDDEGYPVALINGAIRIEDNNLVEVAGLPGGFLRMTRKVMEGAYENAARKGAWKNKGNYGSLPVTEIFYRSFEPQEDETLKASGIASKRRSGDYQFCHDMRKLGFKVWCDPNLTLGHAGRKVWTGNVGRYWMDITHGWPALLKPAVETLKSTQEPEEAMKALETMCSAFGNKPWAADPALLGALHAYASDENVQTVLETGTGVSTAVLMTTGKHLTSLEAEPIWGQKTSRFLADCGFNDDPVVFSPIVQHPFGRWYDYQAVQSPDLLFIDGPRRDEVGMRARVLDAVNVERTRFIVIDDVNDGDGRMLMKRVEDSGFNLEVVHNPARCDFAIAEAA